MDYKDTLNLPRTEFPMRANLAVKELDFLKSWKEMDLYGNSGNGTPDGINSYCTTARPTPTAISISDTR